MAITFSHAQKEINPFYEVESVTIGSNLSSLQINKLFQDSRGFIWMGTDMGLASYDGIEFTNYNFASGHRISTINDITEDDNGRLWAGGENGLFYLEGHEFIRSSIKELGIKAVLFEQSNNFLIAGSNFIPKSYNPNQLDSILNGSPVKGKLICKDSGWQKMFMEHTVWEMEADDDGGLWIGLENKLLLKEGTNLSEIYRSEKIKTNISEIVAINRDSVYWGNELTGLYFKNAESINMIIAPITYMMERTDSSILFLTPMDLIKYESGHYDTLSKLENYDHLYFKDMLQDIEGNVWIATEGSLLKLSEQYFHSWTLMDSELLGSNHSITQLNSGQIVIGSSKKEVLEWRDGEFQKYKQIPAAFNSTTEAILEDDDGSIWYGTSMSGVILEEGRLLTQFGEEEGIIDKTIHFIKKDRFNRLWCGGENGISEIVHNDSGIIFNNFRPQLKPAIIPIFIDLICLDSGHCYAISRNAIYEVLDDQLVKISFEKIRELPVISKVIDKGSDQLMIATLGGGILKVSVDQNNTWNVDEVYDQSSGLISNNILNIHLDKESRLWSISQNGTCVIDNNAVRCYDKNDGWLPLETTHVDVQESEDGNLWVVANSSISVFPLYNLRENRHLPKVHITNISLFKDTSTVASYVTDIEKGHELILPHDQNFIEFKFVSTSLSKNGKNKFIYKLEGLDEDWNSPSKKTFVQYAGLKPGAYTFRVKAINNSGLEGTDEAAYSFTIKWPWYSTWWAIFIYFLLFVISLYYLLQLINSRKEKVLEAERLRSRNDFQSNFYTNVSHEFRTPLTVIMGVTEQIREELKKNSLSLDQELKMINRNATSLLSLVNQILNLSKLKHSKVQLLFINVNIIGFISQVIESVRPFAKSQNKEILFYSEEDELFMDIDEMTTTTLLINLISKAIKNTDQDQNIIVHVKVEEENQSFLSIKIRNGDLRNPHPRSSVKVHQNGISTDKEKGTEEIEIALAQQVVEILGGKFKFSNENDEVLEYLVMLPIKDQIKSKKNPSYKLSDAHLSSKKRIEVVPKDHVQGRKSILLVEDNQDVAQYIVEFLEKIYNVGYAQDGAKAMQLIKVSHPDLVVCDIMMPVMNGYEVCQAIRASEKTRNIPIIILTAKADINSRILGMAKGADAYLTKPFSQAELLAKIERLITKSSTAPQLKSDENFLSVLDIKSNDPGQQFIAKAASFILDNIENEVYGPVFLSRDMEVSESSLYKKLKSLSGKSTAVFMRSIRLAKAREILLKTDVSITKVASTTGFKNASWFSRAFKKEFGYPPSDLRKEEI